VLIGGAGGDLLIGGAGIDTVSYLTASAGVDARMLAGVLNTGDAAGDGYVSIENLIGSEFADTLIGGAEDNTLAGRGGNDLLIGYLGNDVLNGGGGRDTVSGETGNDRLHGGNGADILIGDVGSDVFDFDTVAESSAGALARDVIRAGSVPAFEGAGATGGDLIDLSGIDANVGVAGNQAFVFGGGGTGRVSVVDTGGSSLIRANTDNDAAFEFELLVEDGGVLASAYKAGDFIL
jgi:Ca2+-binding RTX toxin-like protein